MTVGFIEKTRCVNRELEIRCILDTNALRQASNLELLRKPFEPGQLPERVRQKRKFRAVTHLILS